MIKLVSSKIIESKVNKISKIQFDLRINIFSRLYLKACEIFPENKLLENRDLSKNLVHEILGLESHNLSVDETCIRVLRERISSDVLVQQGIADYHRMTAYIYHSCVSRSLDSDRVEEALHKAKEVIDDVEYLSKPEFKILSESVRKDKRLLKKRIRIANKLKVEREKSGLIPPVKVTASHFSVSLTFISTLFLISGFVYTKSFFYWFGINVGGFYNIQDYLSSSIDVISSTAFSAVIGLAGLCNGLYRSIDDELHDDQFDIDSKRKGYVIPFILVTSCFALTYSIYTSGRWPNIFVFPIVLFLLIEAFHRIPFLKFVENKTTIGSACLVIAIFFMHLGFTIKSNVESVFLDDYEPIYSIELQDKYKTYSQMSYLTSNSNFVFLIDVDTKEVVVLPKNSVTSYRTNS
ncbi:hypothetical protein [Vibrio splendidus]|uniref:hypothetical protein n=1 Tax=Vibrio splendidus TaxID=29497 RepID=UPI000D3D34DF|nr:hypothetical protein [Vibrio splendidus]PTP05113.1 hypothetical protein CWN86_15630 [Vibrio splendidus]PTP22289.1 hypothetical protein CWN85_15395 [Vibrio splendidus]